MNPAMTMAEKIGTIGMVEAGLGGRGAGAGMTANFSS